MAVQPHQDEVLKELPAIGKLRVRVLKGRSGKVLDIREYVQSDSFEGFTRRGIRMSPDHVADLQKILPEAAELLKEKA